MKIRYIVLTLVCVFLALSAWGEVWDGTFEASPANDDTIAAGPGKIRDTRDETRFRSEVEHHWGSGDGLADDNGMHRIGSAKCFYATSAPTVLFDSAKLYLNSAGTSFSGESDLDNSADNSAGLENDDVGTARCWIDTDGADNETNNDCSGSEAPSACCTGTNTGTCDDDDNTLHIYIGVAGDAGSCDTGYLCGWQPVTATADAFSTGADILADDEVLSTSFNNLYNGGFDISDGTGLVSSTSVPAGWAFVTTPTVAYADSSTDTRWGDGFHIAVTNAGATNEGIQQTLTNLPSDTLFKVVARAKDDGTAVCTLDVTNEGGTAFSSDATTTNDWETLSGTFGTTVGSLDTVEITMVTTGADLLVCLWDHIGVYEIGAVTTDRDEVAPPSVLAVLDAESGDNLETIADDATLTALTSFAANFTPPGPGWVVQIGWNISLGSDAIAADETGWECQLQLGGSEVSGTHQKFILPETGGASVDFQSAYNGTTININPTAGTALVYTIACADIGTLDTLVNEDATESNLWLIAHPPR